MDRTFGSGQVNTSKIVSILGPGNYAAYLCDTLTLNGYNDWFLPSWDELDSMLYNLATKGLAKFANEQYWSSTHYITIYSHSYGSITNWACCGINDPTFGIEEDQFYDYSLYYVRAIRAF